jgi:2,4-diketo-3-deoxy-L-fuconate hydrolase
MGQKPPTYLKAKDVMDLTINGLGTQRQHVIQG